MKNYTIGIYFNANLTRVALILKNRPQWQAGKFNFPGGHIEQNESAYLCISRELKEECGIQTMPHEWEWIGLIHNKQEYKCQVLTCIQNRMHGDLKTMEDQEVTWVDIDKMPENCISNLLWLVPFALNYWKQGNDDKLVFGNFEYRY